MKHSNSDPATAWNAPVRPTRRSQAGFGLCLSLLAVACAPLPPRSPAASFAVVAITAGAAHTCVLTRAGGVACFGANEFGQLGNGTTDGALLPAAVSGLSAAVAIAAGRAHTCALTEGGTVKCWGHNNEGQLGNGTTTDSSTPVSVSQPFGAVRAIAAGGDRTCALARSGALWCWGYQSFKNGLGNPQEMEGFSGRVAAVAVGRWHACATTEGGEVSCWGVNGYGQLGNGAHWPSIAPVAMSELASGVAALAAGDSHSCALMAAGGVQCWGGNYYNQLGDGAKDSNTAPVKVSGLSDRLAAIAAGAMHTCVLTRAGAVQCWGYNVAGQIGNGTTADAPAPVEVSGLSAGVVAVAAGAAHTCALTSAGEAMCWGSNSQGQLGNGTTTNALAPVAVRLTGRAEHPAVIDPGLPRPAGAAADGGSDSPYASP